MFALSFIGGAIGDLSVFESTEVCFVSRLNCHCCTVAICSLPGLCLKCSSYASTFCMVPFSCCRATLSLFTVCLTQSFQRRDSAAVYVV